jgi:hypothetical protein
MDFTAKQMEAIQWAVEYTIDGIEEHSDYNEDKERADIHTALLAIAEKINHCAS